MTQLHTLGLGVTVAFLVGLAIYTGTLKGKSQKGGSTGIVCGVILGTIGSAAIFITVNCPSWGVEKDFTVLRCLGHWLGAVLFAGCCAIPLVILLLSKAIKEKGRFLGALIAFGLVLVALLVLTVAGFKSAIIENIPMTAAYVLLFMLNFTHFFEKEGKAA